MKRFCDVRWFAVLAVMVAMTSVATAAPKKKAADAKGRLPRGYAAVVDDAQREKIYEVQSNFADKLADLKKQLQTLISERDAAVEAILTPEQREKVASSKGAVKPKKAGAKPAAKKKAAA